MCETKFWLFRDVSVAGNRVPCMEIFSISICSYGCDDSPRSVTQWQNISFWWWWKICYIWQSLGLWHFAAAELGFTLKPIIPNVNLKFHGRISTRYSNFKYSTHYQKKYYQRILFEKGESNSVKYLCQNLFLLCFLMVIVSRHYNMSRINLVNQAKPTVLPKGPNTVLKGPTLPSVSPFVMASFKCLDNN